MTDKQVIYIIQVNALVEDVIADIPGYWVHTDVLDENGECPVCRADVLYLANDQSAVCLDCKVNWGAESKYPDAEWLEARIAEMRAQGRTPPVFDISTRKQRKDFGRD